MKTNKKGLKRYMTLKERKKENIFQIKMEMPEVMFVNAANESMRDETRCGAGRYKEIYWKI